jgi:recombination protein RecR
MAERLVLFLFKQDIEKIRDFAENLLEIKNMKICKKCFNIAESELCEYCKDERRDQHSICVVEEPLDIISLERTKAYHGLYHVLGGVIQVGDSGAELKIPELISRIENEGITEVILATNPTTEGDATALYLKRKIQSMEVHPHTKDDTPDNSTQNSSISVGVKITRLGRGLSTGADLEYADELTISEALTNRKEL